MREKEIEKMLVNAVKIHGGLALKFVSPNFNGMPDRLILLPFGKAKKAIRSIRVFGVLH